MGQQEKKAKLILIDENGETKEINGEGIIFFIVESAGGEPNKIKSSCGVWGQFSGGAFDLALKDLLNMISTAKEGR